MTRANRRTCTRRARVQYATTLFQTTKKKTPASVYQVDGCGVLQALSEFM